MPEKSGLFAYTVQIALLLEMTENSVIANLLCEAI